jgi:alkanesulfonate monooxygenase SsuD/methylene tetrahydromethanopterin reductase-like flavin-dependent oxidoreductase (luciferase family)
MAATPGSRGRAQSSGRGDHPDTAGLGVIVLPQRQPVLLAKQVSSVDNLAKGRLTVGIDVGYVGPELRALADQGSRADEYLAVMRTLWTEPEPSFHGVSCPSPACSSSHHPGAAAPSADCHRRALQAACRRAVTTAGWYGVYLDLKQTAAGPARRRSARSNGSWTRSCPRACPSRRWSARRGRPARQRKLTSSGL